MFFHETWFNWTLQTYARLITHGFPCEISNGLPESGIVLAARCDVPFDLMPRPGQLIACMVADATAHPFAQVQVVQNSAHERPEAGVFYMPHWPQPGLIPRASSRGDTCANVAYFGHRDQLAAELKMPGWPERLSRMGLRWMPVFEDSSRKTDYSDVDIVIGVRSFDGHAYDNKPASKLVNAWHAGVPAVLGPESAFRAERRSDLDYLEVATYDGLYGAVSDLARSTSMRVAMMRHARARAAETSVARMVARWETLILDELVPAYDTWRASGTIRRAGFRVGRYLAVRRRGMAERFRARGAAR